MSNDQQSEKDIAYYSAIVNGWLTTRLEHDKSILALSSGGIALLVTLLSTQGANTPVIYILFIVASVAFLVSIISVIVILKQNARHLERIINKSEKGDPILRFLDSVSSYSFVIGVLLTLVIGLGIGANTIQQEREAKEMGDEKQVKTIIETNKGTLKRSWDGVANLAPDQGGENTQSGQDSQGNQQSEQQDNQNSSQSNDKE